MGKPVVIYRDANDCKTNLRQADRDSKHPKVQAIFKEMFPGCTEIEYHDDDLGRQFVGIDATIHANGEAYPIEIKIRYRNAKTGKLYNDVLLEFISNDVSGDPSWVVKETYSEYFIYLIPELGVGYKFSAVLLQRAWERLGESWKAKYGVKKAFNRQYYTHNVAVPWPTLEHVFTLMLPKQYHEKCLYRFEPFCLEKEVFELTSDPSNNRLLKKIAEKGQGK